MKVKYKSLTVDEAFELIKEDSKRRDLFFEEKDRKNPPSELANINYYELAAVDFGNQAWFQRETEDEDEKRSRESERVLQTVE